MPVYALTGNDTIQIAGRVLRNLGDGDVGKIAFPNELVGVKRGKNGNAVFALNAMGKVSEVILRIIRGSPDDAFLNGQLISQESDFPSFPLMAGYIVKRIGDGAGGVANDTYIMAGGVFTKIPELLDNVEGATDQAVTIYNFKFANNKRQQL